MKNFLLGTVALVAWASLPPHRRQISRPGFTARPVAQHRLDGGPFIIAEFVAVRLHP